MATGAMPRRRHPMSWHPLSKRMKVHLFVPGGAATAAPNVPVRAWLVASGKKDLVLGMRCLRGLLYASW